MDEDFEITPEMVQAGVDVYLDWDSTDEYSLDKLVKSLYREMSKASPRPIHEEQRWP